ncbi:isoprenyl transferase [Candidatus Sulfidibacterium hydrothermale]|uniref:isoprenyl transferase n=1 Tax=Candidatus Sulfidibacterium hydrothermale TaxID=2875962 RepID=UPI001F0A5E18|nr:isoprenyl transferase [Candidatus Sulfidibacterium hydrothermale]UBM62068.1 isoprenyl transferase [Candidatus Sulfidibacterium hydrothermale]
MELLKSIDPGKLPSHVAIIMDGNGRWAKRQGRNRAFGHHKGVDAVRTVAETAAELGIQYLTLYTFSTENWNRPKEEVDALMHLFVETIEKEIPTLNKNNIRLNAIGDINGLPELNREKLVSTIKQTQNNDRMVLTLALNYSGRWEMVDAIRKMLHDQKKGLLNPEDVNEKTIASYLNTAHMPEPELVIRTSGEQRISNFLLWQIAYSELYFTPVLWPDFGKDDFYEAIIEYQRRERRFGLTEEQIKNWRTETE